MENSKRSDQGITLAEASARLVDLQLEIWLAFTGGAPPIAEPAARQTSEARTLDELLSELVWLDWQLFGATTEAEPCCPQPEAQGAEADPRSAGDLGHASEAVGNTVAGGALGSAAPAPAAGDGYELNYVACTIPVPNEDRSYRMIEVVGWEVIPFDPDEHRAPKHPPSRLRVPGCDCVACTRRPRLNKRWPR